MAFAAGIVEDFFAVFVEHGLRSPSVFEAMEVNADTRGVQEPDLMEQVEDAAVIDGVWHIQAYDM
jgi:hypothetical protein